MSKNICSICHELLGRTKTTIVHDDKKEVNGKMKTMWKHEYHTECIESWKSMCVKNYRTPCCPMCPNFAITIPNEAAENAMDLFNGILREIPEIPYIGIAISDGTQIIKKLINHQLRLTHLTTMDQLKETVMTMGREIYDTRGVFCIDNLSHNLSIKNWAQWKYPTLRIADAHYGIPSSEERIGKFNVNIDGGCNMGELYVDYHTRIAANLTDDALDEDVKKSMRDVCCLKNIRFRGPTGIDDPGHYEKAYVNMHNPEIHEQLRAYEYHPMSTEYPIAWLIIHIEYA